MVASKRNCREYNLDNVLEMGYKAFEEMLGKEEYSLVLIYRLLDLKAYFLSIENYEMIIPIRNWFDLHSIQFEDDEQ